jgi:hypothetical protein
MVQMGIFQQIYQDKRPIRLLNVYKGIPISTTGIILVVGSESITVHTEKSQVVSMYHDKQTFIQNELADTIYRAKVKSIDFKNVNAVLTDFEVADDQIGQRTQVRVAPADPIRSVVKTSEIRSVNRCMLADISESGLAIYIRTDDFSPVVYKTGVRVNLSFTLPLPAQQVLKMQMPERDVKPRYNNLRMPNFQHSSSVKENNNNEEKKEKLDAEVELAGTIVNIHTDKRKGCYRVGVKVVMNDQSKIILTSFMAMRQAEIIRDIREEYQELASRADE